MNYLRPSSSEQLSVRGGDNAGSRNTDSSAALMLLQRFHQEWMASSWLAVVPAGCTGVGVGGKQMFLWVHPPDEFAPLTGSRELAQMSSPCRSPASLWLQAGGSGDQGWEIQKGASFQGLVFLILGHSLLCRLGGS